MTETLYISKESKDKYCIEEVVNAFNNSDSLDELKAYVEKAEDRLFVSWASVDGVDKDKEKIPISLVIKAQEELMKRGAPIMYRHTNKNVGRTLAYKVQQHPRSGRLGVLHLNLIYNTMDIDNEVWNGIQSGELKGLSVGGQGVIGSREYDDNLKSMVDVYSKYNQYETSVVKNPAHPLALNEAVSAIAKEEKMTQEKEIQEIVKELSSRVESLEKELKDSKKEATEEAPEPKPEETQQEETPEEPIEKACDEKKTGISIEDLASQMGEMKKKVDEMYKESVKKEESPKEETPELEADNEVEAVEETEEQPKEEQAEVEKESQEVEKEEIIVTEAPSTKSVEETGGKDVIKEYNETMDKFHRGELSYEQVLEQYRQ